MSRNLTMALVSSLVMVTAVLANAGPPPLSKDRKVSKPPVRFEGIDKQADYVFVLAYHVSYLATTYVEVKDSQAVNLDFNWKDRKPTMTYMALLAMDRKAFDKRKKDDPSLKWLTAKTNGVLEAKLTPPETTVPITVKEIPTTIYRVTLTDGKLRAEKAEDKKCGDDSSGLLRPWTFCIVSSLSIAWLGIWFVRRGEDREFGRVAQELCCNDGDFGPNIRLQPLGQTTDGLPSFSAVPA